MDMSQQDTAATRNIRQSCLNPEDLSDRDLHFELTTLQEDTHRSLTALRAHHERELAEVRMPLLLVLRGHDEQDLAEQHVVRRRVANMRAALARHGADDERTLVRLAEMEQEELARRQQLQAANRARRMALYSALLDTMKVIKDAEYEDEKQYLSGNVLFETRLRRVLPRAARLTKPGVRRAHEDEPKSYLEAARSGLP